MMFDGAHRGRRLANETGLTLCDHVVDRRDGISPYIFCWHRATNLIQLASWHSLSGEPHGYWVALG